MKRVILLITFVAVVAGALLTVARSGAGRTEEERIRESIEGARQGLSSRRLGEVMAWVSQDYDDGVYNRDSLRGMLAYGLREQRDLSITLYLKALQVAGDRATAELDVDAMGVTAYGGPRRYRGTLRVVLAREPSYHHIVFPDHRWRVVRVENMEQVRGEWE